MKNVFKKVLTIGALAGAFVTGYFVNESDNVNIETPVQAETQTCANNVNNNVKQGLNEIESGERNVFTQYFTITAIDEKGTDVQNQYNENDTYYIDKQDYDLDFNDLEVGTKIAVTFDHDTTITAVYDERYYSQYKLVSAKYFNVDIDESQYIYGINNDKPNDTIVLNKDDWQIGDLVNVTFNTETHDDIKEVVKVGMWKEDLDRFYEKSEKEETVKNTEKQKAQNTEIVNIEKNEQLQTNNENNSEIPKPLNNEIVKEKEAPVQKEEQKTQDVEKVNKNVETPKTEQNEVKKEESSPLQNKEKENKNQNPCTN